MADTERRDFSTRPKIGDIVEVTWEDHYMIKKSGGVPNKLPVARSWGVLETEDSKGVLVTQTGIIDQDPKHAVDELHEGQFVMRTSMISIKRVAEYGHTFYKPEVSALPEESVA